ncbi:hypothetical protein D8824_02065 [Streptococcus intermedius]|nr:hypothetical protein D8833_02055 [Streptococcus intermedius]RSJ17689.1 hypothetical protein D8831_02065 [Streptococcus intermedius]RSJ32864.1 hypothetical protein D8824_02065 [Streptococcus intermedius]
MHLYQVGSHTRNGLTLEILIVDEVSHSLV